MNMWVSNTLIFKLIIQFSFWDAPSSSIIFFTSFFLTILFIWKHNLELILSWSQAVKNDPIHPKEAVHLSRNPSIQANIDRFYQPDWIKIFTYWKWIKSMGWCLSRDKVEIFAFCFLTSAIVLNFLFTVKKIYHVWTPLKNLHCTRWNKTQRLF